MKQEYKDKLYGIFLDALEGLKWSGVIASCLLMIAYCAEDDDAYAQSVEMNVSPLVKMNDGTIRPSIGASFVYDISPRFAFSIDGDIAIGTSGYHTFCDNSNVVASIRTYVLRDQKRWPDITLRTGIGWGHTFGSFTTDHNFHTYVVGLMFSRSVSNKFSIYLSPLSCWRTYAEHIGFDSSRGWYRLEMGVRYYIFKLPRLPTS